MAALFMAGVEAAIFANDACGGPLAWWFLGPWQYFDGKLFHYTLLRANVAQSLIEVGGGGGGREYGILLQFFFTQFKRLTLIIAISLIYDNNNEVNTSIINYKSFFVVLFSSFPPLLLIHSCVSLLNVCSCLKYYVFSHPYFLLRFVCYIICIKLCYYSRWKL